jgi:hypothetical protein
MEEKLYAVAGFDNLYAGRDGMIKRKVFYGTEDLAWEVAKGLAESVIFSNEKITNDLEEMAHDQCDFEGIANYFSNEADRVRNFIATDDREWEIYELDESKLPTKHYYELTDMFNNNPKDFIDKYARGYSWTTMLDNEVR